MLNKGHGTNGYIRLLGKKAWIRTWSGTNISVTNAWGNIYISDKQTFDISSLGLSKTPIIIPTLPEGNSCQILNEACSNSSITFDLTRGSASATVTASISFLIISND